MKEQLIMRDQKNRPAVTTYIVEPTVVKGKKTASLLCLIFIAILIWSL